MHNAGKRWLFLTVLAVLLVSLFLATGCGNSVAVGTQVGQMAPDFVLPTLTGESRRLSDFRGQTVILNFWATWCGPCRAEMPDMQVLYTELSGRKLVVLGVNQGESRQTVAQFAHEFEITFPVFLDSARTVANQYGVRAYPTTFIIDESGVIQHVVVGGPLTRSYLRRQVDALLQ